MTAADWHRIWARGALSDGNRIAARKHARKSLALQRLNPRAMGVLMASALPARFAATLLALRARLLRRRERDSTLPEGDGQGGDE